MRTTANIVVRSHSFTVTGYNDDFYRVACRYAATLMDYKLESVMSKGRRVLVKKPDRVFAASTASRKELRFHINCLEAFKRHMQNNGWAPNRFKMIYDTPGEGVDMSFAFVSPDIGPRDNAQREWLSYQLARDQGEITTKINNARTGGGKAQPLDALFKTPDGWLRNGDAKVGDKLLLPNGEVYPIAGVFPQGLKRVYRVHFEDGRYTDCCIDHLWNAYQDYPENTMMIDTRDLMNMTTHDWQPYMYIPLVVKDLQGPPVFKDGPQTYRDNDPKYTYSDLKVMQKRAWSEGRIARLYNDTTSWVLDIADNTENRGLRVLHVEDRQYEVEMQCIMLNDLNNLYITDDYIVTHNTFMALYNMVKLGKRTVITLSPKYLQTWLTAIGTFIDSRVNDICVVRGSDEVNGVLKQAEAGTLEAKIIIISLQTYQYFMSEYENNNGVMTHYQHTPDEFWKILNPGFLIVDEGHESIHALFKYDLYLNVRNKLVCTATLEADSAFINEMYRIIYPMKWRFKQGGYDKYIESVAVMYGLKNTKKVKYKGFGGTYSHVKFEQSVLKHDHIASDYVRFINSLVDFFYIKVMKPNMKLLIYCATVDMCIVVTDYLERFYREQGLRVAKYTQEDPTEALYENDIVVSTLKSAGTGVDIPGLRTAVMTVAVGSRQLNIQSLGRLRELKDYPEINPTFVYVCCTDIPQHMQYHHKKVTIFEDKTLSQRSMNSGFSL